MLNTSKPIIAQPVLVLHPLLSRLAKEVEKEALMAASGRYDRTHNRHNRGQ